MMKIKNMRIQILIFLLSIISGCKWNDSNLGKNYYYLNEYNAVDMGFPDGAIIYKSKEENVFQDIKVSGNVVKVDYDENFIIAKRIARESMNDTSYFIIIKKTDTVLGPLNLKSFRQKEIELNIELNL